MCKIRKIMNIRKIFLTLMLCSAILAIKAQTATQVLDKTAAVVGRSSGCSAAFTASSAKYGTTSGTIAIKGSKFHARTPQAIVWFDGKTQWSYLKQNEEVNISTPTQAQQMRMNPMTFIHIYKTGYTQRMTKQKGSYFITLTAKNKKRTVQQMQIWINSRSYVPTKIRMRQGNSWTTITVRNFSAAAQPNSLFRFNAKDFPNAEVIDLR